MKATIQNVTIQNGKAVVNYSTGTVREYPADKMPKTVQIWIEEHNDSIQEEKETTTENTIETVQHEIMIIPQLPAVVREEKETANTAPQEVKIPAYKLIPYAVLLIIAIITRQLSTVCYMIADILQTAGAVSKRMKDIYMIYRYPVYEYIQYIRMNAQDAWAWREEIIRENRGAEE